MAQIKVILMDDFGNEIQNHVYSLSSNAGNMPPLTHIETEIESLRPAILSDITRDLLIEEQKSFLKKQNITPTDTTT
jgi:hypothetical protein